ncbi:methylmalonic aciduria/homocystinuria type D-like protein [Chloropicon primus]|uniref:Methylmalonic aciduria/homocystinuria type D-like protein n=1 Tax=Chloropicon primus TaxID=1764295 RepID=A0A5B8MVK9_9CHLO|nr:methylmalonic aciduria/homocystinuria type D-like protein [Chloropicon primus]UPR04048.1 methylmalonic aciduria/homocystinuria type D-like protein [Chloropicon primus]|eukprot:QDZ24838.1 methylmalonic aciduria/homocystinuria type D-like protein [Chloropicon primus]
MSSGRGGGHVLTPATLVGGLDLEYSIHTVPLAQRDDVLAVVSMLSKEEAKDLKVVATCQRAREDLVTVGEQVEREKDRLLLVFTSWAKALCASLDKDGHWCDYIDPCSGLLMVHKESQAVYDEVAALSVLRGYKCSNAGCCKVVLHPNWGSFIYPATFLTTAPHDVLLRHIGAIEAKDHVKG